MFENRAGEASMSLSDEQLAQYFDDGFLIVEDVFTDEELRRCCRISACAAGVLPVTIGNAAK